MAWLTWYVKQPQFAAITSRQDYGGLDTHSSRDEKTDSLGGMILEWRVWDWLRKLVFGQRRGRTRASTLRLSWVIPGKLAVGNLPKQGDCQVLQSAQIHAVLSLCSEREGPLPEDVCGSFRCGRVVLPDSHYHSSIAPEELGKAVEVIHRAIQRQMPLYVHCLAGVERSPLVCLAYLCQYRSLRVMEALYWLKQVHPPTNPTPAQLQVLQVYLNQLQASQG